MENLPKQAVKNEETLIDVGIDYSEIILDTFLEEGVLEEIPILKTVVALYKAGKSIKDYYSRKKLTAFLTGCQGLERKKVLKFIDSLENEKTREDIGMRVLLIVDKVDVIQKAELIGRTLKLLIDDQISLTFYLRLCNMIEKSFYTDILELKHFTNADTIITSTNKIMDSIVLESLFSCGLISDYGFDGGEAFGENSGTRYGLNAYSIQLKKVL